MVTTQINKSDYSNFSQIHHYLPKPFSTTPSAKRKSTADKLSPPPRGGEMGRSGLFFFLFHITIKNRSVEHVLNYGYLIPNTLSNYHK
jgi:hypothetical protein